MSELKVINVPITDLDLDPANVRTHSKKNLKAIADSLMLFGQRKPIVAMRSGDRYVVIAGNGTTEAAAELGWTHLSVAVAPEDWTSDQAAAFAIADNRSAELADWDAEGLRLQLSELEASGWDVNVLGFDAIDDGDAAIEVIEDEPPVPQEEAVTKTGDVWVLGNHRLICGDSTELGAYKTLMESSAADCIFTDPPYNVAYESANGKTIANDNMTDDAFAQFLRNAYKCMYESAKDGGAIYVCHADSAGHIFRNEMTDAGFLLKQCLVWVKDQFALSRQDYNWQHEPILYGWKPGAAHVWVGKFNNSTIIDNDFDPTALKKQELVDLINAIKDNSTIVREDRPRRNEEHPTMKPVKLVARLIANNTRRGEIVLDPFGGSESTLIACEQIGRVCRTIELDPIYCDVIVKRWENLTGQTAVLEGETCGQGS